MLPNLAREDASPATEPLTSEDLDALVAADQVKLLYRKTLFPYLVCLLDAVLYSSVVWNAVRHRNLLVWLGAVVMVTVARIILRHMYWRSPRAITEAVKWGNLSAALSGANGLIWGSAALIVFPSSSLPGQALLTLLLGGLAAGATSTSASYRRAYLAFAIPVTLPLVARLTLQSGWIYHVMAIFLLFFLVSMASLAAAIGRYSKEAAQLRFRLASANHTVVRRADELERSAERLRRAEERMRLVMEAVNVGIWYSDFPFDRVHISPGIMQHTGIPDSEVMTEAFLSANHPDDRERVQRAVARCIEHGEDYDVECRTVRLHDGRVRWVRNVGRCFRDPSGKPVHFDGLSYDITKKKEQEVERELLLKELSEADRLRERLLGIVSHDLKTPLNAVAMAANLLHRHAVDEAATKNAARIVRSTERMKRLIGQLLDFARIRATGAIPVEVKPLDLHALCRHVIDEMAAAHPRDAISLEASGDGWGVWDGDRLAQVLSNLLGNAIQHGGGGPISVEVIDEGENVAITVHNEGPAIPPDVLPFIFDPFRQGKRRGKAHSQSVGLGLYIVRQLVLAHGGQIDVKSREGEGTTFATRLPRHRSLRRTRPDEADNASFEAQGPDSLTTLH